MLGRHSSGHRLSVILNQGTLKEGMALPGTRGIGRKSVLSEKMPQDLPSEEYETWSCARASD